MVYKFVLRTTDNNFFLGGGVFCRFYVLKHRNIPRNYGGKHGEPDDGRMWKSAVQADLLRFCRPQLAAGNSTIGPQLAAGDPPIGPQLAAGDPPIGPQLAAGDSPIGPQLAAGDSPIELQLAAEDSPIGLRPQGIHQ